MFNPPHPYDLVIGLDRSDQGAELLLTHHNQLPIWVKEDPQTRLLQQLASHRRAIINERTGQPMSSIRMKTMRRLIDEPFREAGRRAPRLR